MKKTLLLCAILTFIAACCYASGEQVWVYIYDQSSRHYGYFLQTSATGTEWIEYDCIGNKKKFTFTCIDSKPQYVVLLDKERHTYVKLTKDACYLGHSRDDIKEKIYTGKWGGRNTKIDAKYLDEHCNSYFTYEYKGVKHVLAKFKGASSELFADIDMSNQLLLDFYFPDQIQKMDRIVMHPFGTNTYLQLTKDKISTVNSTFLSSSLTFTELATEKWTKGIDYDVAVAIGRSTGDSLGNVMMTGNFYYSAMQRQGLDTTKVKLAASAIASHYLKLMKADKMSILNAAPTTVSVYDDTKKELTIINDGDMYNVPMTGAEAATVLKNAAKISISNRSYYFNGKKFMLAAFTLSFPGSKKSFKYNDSQKTMAKEFLKIDDIVVPMPK